MISVVIILCEVLFIAVAMLYLSRNERRLTRARKYLRQQRKSM